MKLSVRTRFSSAAHKNVYTVATAHVQCTTVEFLVII